MGLALPLSIETENPHMALSWKSMKEKHCPATFSAQNHAFSLFRLPGHGIPDRVTTNHHYDGILVHFCGISVHYEGIMRHHDGITTQYLI